MNRRSLSWILVAAVGVLLIPVALANHRLSENIWPAFDRQMAESHVGQRLESVFVSANEQGAKCPQGFGRCFSVEPGEKGTVVGVLAVRPSRGYFLVVRWDKGHDDRVPLYSFLGRYTFRTHVRPAN